MLAEVTRASTCILKLLVADSSTHTCNKPLFWGQPHCSTSLGVPLSSFFKAASPVGLQEMSLLSTLLLAPFDVSVGWDCFHCWGSRCSFYLQLKNSPKASPLRHCCIHCLGLTLVRVLLCRWLRDKGLHRAPSTHQHLIMVKPAKRYPEARLRLSTFDG